MEREVFVVGAGLPDRWRQGELTENGRLHILGRSALGGRETSMGGNLDSPGQPIGGLYAAGKAAGFGTGDQKSA